MRCVIRRGIEPVSQPIANARGELLRSRLRRQRAFDTCGSRAVCLQLREVFFRPSAKRMQGIDQGASEASEGVFDFRRDDLVNPAENQAVSLQTAQCLREHFLGNATDFPLQARVSLSAIGQDLNDERSPFVRDSVQHDARRALGF